MHSPDEVKELLKKYPPNSPKAFAVLGGLVTDLYEDVYKLGPLLREMYSDLQQRQGGNGKGGSNGGGRTRAAAGSRVSRLPADATNAERQLAEADDLMDAAIRAQADDRGDSGGDIPAPKVTVTR